jgi:hypothetical protein
VGLFLATATIPYWERYFISAVNDKLDSLEASLFTAAIPPSYISSVGGESHNSRSS